MGACLSSAVLEILHGPDGEIIRAIRDNNVELLGRYIGSNGNVQLSNGLTAMMYAAQLGHIECMKELLKHGADVDCGHATPKLGIATALMYAAMYGKADSLEFLLKWRANVNLRTNGGETALTLASSNDNPDCVRLLLKNGATVNADEDCGPSALICAVESGHLDCMNVLLRYGPKFNVEQLENAEIKARQNGHTGCAEILWKQSTALTAPKVATSQIKPARHKPDEDSSRQTRDTGGTMPLKSAGWAIPDRPSAPYVTQPATSNGRDEPFAKSEVQSYAPPPPMPSNADSYAINSAESSISDRASAPYMTKPSPPLKENQKDGLHRQWLIPYSDLELGGLLGEGSYAKVYSAKWHGAEVAAKVFEIPSGSMGSKNEFRAALLEKITGEADLLAAVRHPNVVSFLAMCSDPPCMVTEICTGSLFDMLKRSKTEPELAAKMTWRRRLGMLMDAAAGMSHLHQRNPPILHRDLKSLNLLVDSGWKVKISDLGLSKLMEEVSAETQAGSTANSINPRWLGAEVLETGVWLPASDVYAFGVIMWELLTWDLPWGHVANQFMIPMAILKGDPLPVPTLDALPGPSPISNKTHDRYLTLLKKCMDKTPTKRPSFAQVAKELGEIAKSEPIE